MPDRQRPFLDAIKNLGPAGEFVLIAILLLILLVTGAYFFGHPPKIT